MNLYEPLPVDRLGLVPNQAGTVALSLGGMLISCDD